MEKAVWAPPPQPLTPSVGREISSLISCKLLKIDMHVILLSIYNFLLLVIGLFFTFFYLVLCMVITFSLFINQSVNHTVYADSTVCLDFLKK